MFASTFVKVLDPDGSLGVDITDPEHVKMLGEAVPEWSEANGVNLQAKEHLLCVGETLSAMRDAARQRAEAVPA
jgi:hypothetical protein